MTILSTTDATTTKVYTIRCAICKRPIETTVYEHSTPRPCQACENKQKRAKNAK